MRLAMIGLGRMGANISRRLMRGGHEIVGFDLDPESLAGVVKEGAIGAASLEEAVAKLEPPRIFWVMLPAGGPTEEAVMTLSAIGDPGDIIIDGGNSFFKDDIRRFAECSKRRIHYVDVGTSGGVWGLERGYCLMIGGEADVVDRLDRSSTRSRPDMVRFHAPQDARAAIAVPSAVTSMPGRPAPAISRR